MISRVDRFDNHTCWEVDGLDEDNIYRKFLKITKYTQQVSLFVLFLVILIEMSSVNWCNACMEDSEIIME